MSLIKSSNKTITPGDIYEHYKKRLYKIVGIARHTESGEEMVVYQALYDDPQFGSNQLWVRPTSMFLETVDIDGVKVERFTLKHRNGQLENSKSL